MKNEKLIKWILRGVWGVYAVCIMYFTARHTIWFDEAQAWLLARDNSLIELLFYRIRYEGTPALWHLMLYPFAHAFPQAWWMMKVIHVSIAIVTAALILFRSPFAWYQRILIIFGYFFIFEYAVISRNYAIGILILCGVALLFARRTFVPIRYTLLLVALSHTAVFFAIPAIVFGVELLYTLWKQKACRILGVVSGAAMCNSIILVMLLWPPQDLSEKIANIKYTQFIEHGAVMLGIIQTGVLPFPWPTIHFWVLDFNTLAAPLFSIIGVIALALMLLILRVHRIALMLYAMSIVPLIILMSFIYLGGWRHVGILYVIFLVLMWMVYATSSVSVLQRKLLTIILTAHVFTAVPALMLVARYPFSYLPSIARDVQSYAEECVQKCIAVFPEFHFNGVALWLPDQREALYSVYRRDSVTYAVWDTTFDEEYFLAHEEIQSRLFDVMNNDQIRMLVTVVPVETARIPEGWKLFKMYTPEGSIRGELAYVYVR